MEIAYPYVPKDPIERLIEFEVHKKLLQENPTAHQAELSKILAEVLEKRASTLAVIARTRHLNEATLKMIDRTKSGLHATFRLLK